MKPEEVGLSSSRLATLDEVLKGRYIDTKLAPGALTMVYRRGRLAHIGMAGHMDLERGKAMREDTIFRIYSMSKPVTSVALMMLVEQGKLSLDDDVATHIPSWKDLGVYQSGVPTLGPGAPPTFITSRPARPMKVVDLVTHTAGLTYGHVTRTAVDEAYRRLKVNDFATPGGLETLIEQLSTLPLEFSPGAAWNYSVSIDVMGYLVQKLSGMPFGEFLRTRLFEPLGMVDTGFFVLPEKLERFASSYLVAPRGGLALIEDAAKSPYATPPALEAGGAGLVSTAHDYMRFCRMMLGGGTLDGVQILSPKTVQLFGLNLLPDNGEMAAMALPGTAQSEASHSGLGFSIGCAVTIDVARSHLPGTLGAFFWGGAANTVFWIDPREDLAVVFMTQVMARHNLRRDLRLLVYSAMTESFV